MLNLTFIDLLLDLGLAYASGMVYGFGSILL